jgi:ABC-2 type transport system permease protein
MTMTKTLVLARREMAGYFFSPMAYVIGALFLLTSGAWFFYRIFLPGHEASLRSLFDAMAYLMVFAMPVLTMRLVSDEYRSGTIETLMTAPVSDAEVIIGKFLGVMAFYVVLLALTGAYLALVVVYGQPDAGVALAGYLGMLLLGAAFAAVGVFASALTPHQLVAALVSASILAFFALVMQLVVANAPEPINQVAARLNAMSYFQDFSRGVVDTRALVYFLTVTALMLFLGVKTLESKRWR